MGPAGLPPAHTGIEAGALIRRDSDYFGRTVNVAARLASVAGAGEILVTEALRAAAGDVPALRGAEKLAPLELKTSQRIRLQRLHPKAFYKDDLGQVVMPLPRGADPAQTLVEFLGAMVPVEDTSVASAAP